MRHIPSMSGEARLPRRPAVARSLVSVSAGAADEEDDQPLSGLDELERRAIGVPPEEELRVHMVWVAETYGPATIENLIRGLDALGLFADSPFAFTPESVQAARRRAWGFAARELPRLTAEKSRLPGSIFGSVQAELPTGVDCIHLQWFSVSPSLSVLVCGFELSAVEARRPHEALAADHPGRWTPLPDGSTSHLAPSHMQGDRFRRALLERLAGPRAWVRARMRGEFAALDAQAPAAGLVTARLFDPFDPEQTRGNAPEDMWSYRFGAELNSRTPRLRNTANRSLSISTARDSGDRVLWLGGKLEAIAEGWTDDFSNPAEDQGRMVTENAARRIPAPVALHAVACLLDDLYAALARLRDEPPTRRGRRDPRRQLGAALDQVPRLVDARHIAEDLAKGAPQQAFVGYDGSDFTAPPPRKEAPQPSFTRGQFNAIVEGARALDESERRARAAIEVRAGLHASMASIDATRLAIAAVVLAVVAIAASVIGPMIDANTPTTPASSRRSTSTSTVVPVRPPAATENKPATP